MARQCQTGAFLVSNAFRYCTDPPHWLHCLLAVPAWSKTSHCRSSQGRNPVMSSFWVCYSPGMGLTTQKPANQNQEDQIYVLRLGMLPWAISYILSELVSLSDSSYLNSVLDSLTWDSQPENSSMAGFWIMLLYRCSFSCQISCRLELLHLGKPFPFKSHCIWYGWDFRNADLRIR